MCGPRSIKVQACDQEKNELIADLIIGEIQQQTPMGLISNYFVQATHASQSGVHSICLVPSFVDYPEFQAEPYRLTVTIKTDDGHNNKPSWNSDFEAVESEMVCQLGDTVSLNYAAVDTDPEDILRSRIADDFGDS